MKETIKLEFLKRPVDADINDDGGEYGAPRRYGKHMGLDFKAVKEEVHACESGRVVYSGMRPGSEQRSNYGNTVVIDHTPYAAEDERHIYTLYAHLESRSVNFNSMVEKGAEIGVSGNSGMRQWYYRKKHGRYKSWSKGYHLHFEVIDTDKALGWSVFGWPGELSAGDRKDPGLYLGQTHTLFDYLVDAGTAERLKERLEFDPVYDAEQGTWRMDVSLGGKKVGYLDKDTKEIKVSLSEKEFEELLKSPLPPHASKPKTIKYDLGV